MSDTFNSPQINNLFAGNPDLVPGSLSEDQEVIVKMAWAKLDDLFDSDEGGPHLKMRSKNNWTAEKSALLLPYVITGINLGQPPLSFNIDNYPYGDTDATVLLAQGLVVQILKHLIRSYTEQPVPQGTGYSHLSRKDYAQAWQSVLQAEQEEFDKMLIFFRRRYLDLGRGAGLIARKNWSGLPPNRGLMRARGWRWY